jgi:hypothetical protein
MGNFLYSKLEKEEDILRYEDLDDENEYKKDIIEQFQRYKDEALFSLKIYIYKRNFSHHYLFANKKAIIINTMDLAQLIDNINRPYTIAVSNNFIYTSINFVYNLPQKIEG